MKTKGGLSFDEFTALSVEEWEKEVERTLKGKPVSALYTKTYEEIFLKSLYLAEDTQSFIHTHDLPGEGCLVRGSRETGYVEKAWDVAQEMNHPVIEETNRLAVSALSRGQTMLAIQLDTATKQGKDSDQAPVERAGDGVPVSCLQDVEILFKNIDLEKTPLHILTNFTVLPFLSFITAYARKHHLSMESITGTVGTDPLASLAGAGCSPLSLPDMYKQMVEAVKWTKSNAPNLKTIVVDMEAYHNGGAHAVQELAFAIATAVEYIDVCLREGLSLQEVLPRISFSFAVGSHLFMESAKLRAFKLLWSKMVKAFGGDSGQYRPYIHAKTSMTTKTKYDAYTNMLRGTIEAFAAVTGGVDSLAVTAFDGLIRPSNEFSQRIARNTQHILKEEAYLTKVIDPAGGSWYVEALTKEIAEKAWELFQKIEEQGGMFQALKQQFVQKQLSNVLVKRQQDVQTRIERVVGITHYVQPAERLNDQLPLNVTDFYDKRVTQLQAMIRNSIKVEHPSIPAFADAVLQGATISGLMNQLADSSTKEYVEPIRNWRKSAEFEELRLRVEKMEEVHQKPLTVHLVVLGQEKACKPRIELARSFFQSGGFKVDQSTSLSSANEAVQWCNEQQGEVFVLCGTDELYEELGLEVIQQLASAHHRVYVAGKQPANQRDAFICAGAKEIIELHTNAVHVLNELVNELGVN
ncbi:methylmalonyl-CoA mutase family protein [Bacillus songklensis]|uniref:methylmalonyl-CoA mutase n=1 Tax=Bacillus songklensis TaxID=1069116 RepID=A0ABV8AXY2_9BACI